MIIHINNENSNPGSYIVYQSLLLHLRENQFKNKIKKVYGKKLLPNQ